MALMQTGDIAPATQVDFTDVPRYVDFEEFVELWDDDSSGNCVPVVLGDPQTLAANLRFQTSAAILSSSSDPAPLNIQVTPAFVGSNVAPAILRIYIRWQDIEAVFAAGAYQQVGFVTTSGTAIPPNTERLRGTISFVDPTGAA